MSKPPGKERLMNLLLAPHVTEKTSIGVQERNQYTFRVRRDATRTEAAAVELMFNVSEGAGCAEWARHAVEGRRPHPDRKKAMSVWRRSEYRPEAQAA
jgi:large subunit ribosomal protein L23